MITRHMRTHVRPDGTPIPLNELLIPPIAQLSLNQPPTPEPMDSSNASGSISRSYSPLPPTGASRQHSRQPSPLPPLGKALVPEMLISPDSSHKSSSLSALLKRNNTLPVETIDTFDNANPILENKKSISDEGTSLKANEAASKLLNSISSANESLNSELILSTLKNSFDGELNNIF